MRTMLLLAAPILIDAKTSRAFLEQTQQLGGQLVNLLAADTTSPDKASAALVRSGTSTAQRRGRPVACPARGPTANRLTLRP